jgi:hypothetical protein
MSRAITFDSRLRMRSLHKHVSASSSDWTIALTVTASTTSRWHDTLLGTGPHIPGSTFRCYAPRMGWNVRLMQTGHTSQHGFGFTTKISEALPCLLCAPRNLKRPPYVMPQGLDFSTWPERLIAEHPEHVNVRGGSRRDPDAHCGVGRTC